jgi:hypothetical protein
MVALFFVEDINYCLKHHTICELIQMGLVKLIIQDKELILNDSNDILYIIIGG